MAFRLEHDFLGEKQVPDNAYYGIQTLRAVENFPITGVPIYPELLKALAHVKKAAARANMDVHLLQRSVGQAIVQAAEDVIDGKYLDQFIVDSIQGGAGTSINMNMNEVLANRALELLARPRATISTAIPTTMSTCRNRPMMRFRPRSDSQLTPSLRAC